MPYTAPDNRDPDFKLRIQVHYSLYKYPNPETHTLPMNSATKVVCCQLLAWVLWKGVLTAVSMRTRASE